MSRLIHPSQIKKHRLCNAMPWNWAKVNGFYIKIEDSFNGRHVLTGLPREAHDA
jgi:hypothetical protein